MKENILRFWFRLDPEGENDFAVNERNLRLLDCMRDVDSALYRLKSTERMRSKKGEHNGVDIRYGTIIRNLNDTYSIMVQPPPRQTQSKMKKEFEQNKSESKNWELPKTTILFFHLYSSIGWEPPHLVELLANRAMVPGTLR